MVVSSGLYFLAICSNQVGYPFPIFIIFQPSVNSLVACKKYLESVQTSASSCEIKAKPLEPVKPEIWASLSSSSARYSLLVDLLGYLMFVSPRQDIHRQSSTEEQISKFLEYHFKIILKSQKTEEDQKTRLKSSIYKWTLIWWQSDWRDNKSQRAFVAQDVTLKLWWQV